MKAAIVGLGVATVAFGGSTIYLHKQLGEERERAAQVEASTLELQARIADLEKARNEWVQRRVAGSAGFVSGNLSDGRSMALPAPPPAAASAARDPQQPVWTTQRHEPSPAMQKMMRNQMRATNKRIYADVGGKLGLDKDTASKLIDLLTDQQLAGVSNFVLPGEDPTEVQRRYEQTTRDNEMAINDLIGADKAMALKEYQQTLPARMAVESLVQQLGNHDVRVSDEQRRKLVEVHVEERARVPYPRHYDGIDPEAFRKSMSDWQEDYEKRISAEASRILDSSQLAAFNEIQQLNQEMRAHFRSVGVPGMVQLESGVSGNATVFATAAPAAGVSVSIENAPPPGTQQK
jgi:hypothetical protein